MAYDPRRFHDPDRPFGFYSRAAHCTSVVRHRPWRVGLLTWRRKVTIDTVVLPLAETLPRSHCGKPIQLLELDCPVQVLWAYAETVDATTSEPQPGTSFCVSPNPHPDPTDALFHSPRANRLRRNCDRLLRGARRKQYSSVVLSVCGPPLPTRTCHPEKLPQHGSVIPGIRRC